MHGLSVHPVYDSVHFFKLLLLFLLVYFWLVLLQFKVVFSLFVVPEDLGFQLFELEELLLGAVELQVELVFKGRDVALSHEWVLSFSLLVVLSVYLLQVLEGLGAEFFFY